jgi:hypothetical protein
MKNDEILDPTTLAIMRDADPLRESSDAYPGMETEAALRYTRARAARRPARSKAWSRARFARIAIVTACVAVVTAVVINIPSQGPVSIPSANAAVLAQARRALIGSPGSILEIDAYLTGKGTEDVTSWTALGGSHNSRLITTTPGVGVVDTATINGKPEIYDPASNSIYVGSPLTAPGADAVGAASWIGMLHQTDVTIKRDVKLDGKDAIEVIQRVGVGTNLYWMQPGTYRPLEFVNRVRGVQGATVIRYRTWRLIPSSAARSSLTSLTAAHPSAKVVDSPPRYAKVDSRLNP